jgi:hypothetical protein
VPQIQVVWIKGVVEIEDPGLNLIEFVQIPPLHHSADLLLPFFTAQTLLILAESVSMAPLGMGELSMRTKLRKTLPFVVAIFIGTMAAALVAGIAILAAHS